MSDRYHPLDEMAQRFYDDVQGRIEWIRVALASNVVLGTKKSSPQTQLAQFLSLGPAQRIQQGAEGADLTGMRSTMFNILGEHALNILPYAGLENMEQPDEQPEVR